MDRRRFLLTSLAGALAAPLAATAQPAGKRTPRIGYLDGAALSAASVRIEALRQGLRERGYFEGQNITIEWRSAEGKADRLPGLAAELVRLKVDVIVTGGAGATRPAREATATIPIVMAQDSDPVGSGFVASLARPGGNVTGLSTLHPEISAKRLEILKEMLPRLSRVAFFGTSTWVGNAQGLREAEQAAAALGVKLQYLDVLGPKDFQGAFQGAGREQAEAGLMLVWGPVLSLHRREVAELAARSRLPTMYRDREHVEAGGLMAYGPSIPDSFRRAAVFVDKILKGAKPADLPIEQPTKFEFVINLKTAKGLGLTIPPSLLARADQVIE
jgi:putative tryptophan/tyrosine transport system substrate-binding protein